MQLPEQIRSAIHDESFAGVTYHVRGELGQGEQIDVEAGGWLYKDPSVKLESVTMGLKTGMLGGGGKLTWNRFTGPGKLAIQTMFIAPLEGVDTNMGAAATGGVAGALISSLARG